MKRIITAIILLLVSVIIYGGEPTLSVDPYWPKTLPNQWILGQVSGVAVDSKDHVWVLQRPDSLIIDEIGAEAHPPVAICCKKAPPVIEFDSAGNIIQTWGGPGKDYQWPTNEHSIYVDKKGFVWISGSGDEDGQILKFTSDGKFVLQIGKEGPQTNSNDTTRLGSPAGMEVDDAANEIYVADGYYNHRVIVFDATTGAYKRHWGAYGKRPKDSYMRLPLHRTMPPSVPPSADFANPVHFVHIAHDGLVYVGDRSNDRIQVFHKNGEFVKEFIIEPKTAFFGSAWDFVFSTDSQQRFLYLIDGTNNQLLTIDRNTGKIISRQGHAGRYAGQFLQAHDIAMDSKGDLYIGEVDLGKRIQKFHFIPKN